MKTTSIRLLSAMCLLVFFTAQAQLGSLINKTKTLGSKSSNSNSGSSTGTSSPAASASAASTGFRDGDRVEANYKDAWRKGTVSQVSSAGRVQVYLDENPGMSAWIDAVNVRAIDEKNRKDIQKEKESKQAFQVGDLVEFEDANYLLQFGKVRKYKDNDLVDVGVDGGMGLSREIKASDLKKAVPYTGKFAVGQKVAVVDEAGYQVYTIQEASNAGYLFGGRSTLFHEKRLYAFNEEKFNTDVAPYTNLLDAYQAVYEGNYNAINVSPAELKADLEKLTELSKLLQPERDNLPYTPIAKWRDNPNFALSIVQIRNMLAYMAVCGGDTLTSASEVAKAELENMPVNLSKVKGNGSYTPDQFKLFFVSSTAYTDYDNHYKQWRTNRETALSYLGKSEKNDWSDIKPLFEKKNAEFINMIADFSKTYDLEINTHDANLEAITKKAYLKEHPKVVVLKSWLISNQQTITRDGFGIPVNKYNYVSLLCSSPDLKVQFYTFIDVYWDYTGNGNYGPPYAIVDEIKYPNRLTYVLNK